jgi:hypothetical protein
MLDIMPLDMVISLARRFKFLFFLSIYILLLVVGILFLFFHTNTTTRSSHFYVAPNGREYQ